MEEEFYVGHHHSGPRVGVQCSDWTMLGILTKVVIVVAGFCQLKPVLRGAYRHSKMKPTGPAWILTGDHDIKMKLMHEASESGASPAPLLLARRWESRGFGERRNPHGSINTGADPT